MKKFILILCFWFLLFPSLIPAVTQTINTLPQPDANFIPDVQNFLRKESAQRDNYRALNENLINSGGTGPTSGNLTHTITATIGFPLGFYVSQGSVSHTYTASTFTLVYLRDDVARSISSPPWTVTYDSHFVFIETTVGTNPLSVPTPTGCLPLMQVTTNGSAITAVRDARPLTTNTAEATYLIYRDTDTGDYIAEASPISRLPNFRCNSASLHLMLNQLFIPLDSSYRGVGQYNADNSHAGAIVRFREGNYILTATWSLPPLQDFILDAQYAGFTYTAATGDGIWLNSFFNCRFVFGEVHATTTTGAAVRLRPTLALYPSPTPEMNQYTSTLLFGAIGNPNVTGAGMTIEIADKVFYLNTIQVDEWLNCGAGLFIPDLVGAGAVKWNTFNLRMWHNDVHATIGQTNAGSANIKHNTFNLQVLARDRVDANGVGINSYADGNIYTGNIESAATGNSIIFFPGSDNNIIVGNMENGINDQGSGNVWYGGGAVASAGIAVGASPFVYHNISARTQQVFVTGGTVSAVAISHDNVTYYDAGDIDGAFIVPHGAYIKVTYAVAPTMVRHTW